MVFAALFMFAFTHTADGPSKWFYGILSGINAVTGVLGYLLYFLDRQDNE